MQQAPSSKQKQQESDLAYPRLQNSLWVLGLVHMQSTLLSDFLTLPSSSVGLLLKDPCTEAEPVHALEVKERLRTARHVRITRSDDDIRDVSIDKLRKILLIDPEATRLGELLVPTKGKPLDDHEIKRSIDQAFFKEILWNPLQKGMRFVQVH